jgi:hypothetical protein
VFRSYPVVDASPPARRGIGDARLEVDGSGGNLDGLQLARDITPYAINGASVGTERFSASAGADLTDCQLDAILAQLGLAAKWYYSIDTMLGHPISTWNQLQRRHLRRAVLGSPYPEFSAW